MSAQPRLISSTISEHAFCALHGGCVAGETCMHSFTSCRDRSIPTALRQVPVVLGAAEALPGGGAKYGSGTPKACATWCSSVRSLSHCDVVCGFSCRL